MASLLPYLKRLEITEVEESDTPTTVNNYLPIKKILEAVDQEGNVWEPVPVTEIGTVTVSPDNLAASVMGSQTFTAVVTGGDATDLTYKWNVRSGAAQLETSDHLPTVTYTFLAAETVQIQCVVSSANSSNSPQSNIAFVLVSA